LACFAIAFAHGLRIILADPEKHWRLLLTTAFFLSSLWFLLFVGNSSSTRSALSLQQKIVDGSVFGYVVLFVFFPFFLSFVAANIPDEKIRRKSAVR
jgi:hypothetical protein